MSYQNTQPDVENMDYFSRKDNRTDADSQQNNRKIKPFAFIAVSLLVLFSVVLYVSKSNGNLSQNAAGKINFSLENIIISKVFYLNEL